jgi:hypothetical protein
MRRGFVLAVLGGLFMGLSGCQMMDSMANYMKHTFSSTKGTDYVSGADLEDDAWITEAAEEARGNQPRERDPDQWYRNWFMSEKARSIERNFGID